MPPQFAQTQDEAEQRFQQWCTQDPYPSIAPALLNSADIVSYIAATGMVFPFGRGTEIRDKLKPASYEVNLLGTLAYWDSEGALCRKTIGRGQPFCLPKNSICFLELEPEFRLPDYVAIRFNLKIKHVYRGLLLGTGPLVDPGFCGKLFIPIHNLTDRDYWLRGGDGLIWMEFTKLSPSMTPEHPGVAPKRVGQFVRFPEGKRWMQLDAYLSQSGGDQPIRSSIGGEIRLAREAAESARKRVDFISVVQFVAILITLVATGDLVWTATAAERSIRATEVQQQVERKAWQDKVQELLLRVDSLDKAAGKAPETK